MYRVERKDETVKVVFGTTRVHTHHNRQRWRFTESRSTRSQNEVARGVPSPFYERKERTKEGKSRDHLTEKGFWIIKNIRKRKLPLDSQWFDSPWVSVTEDINGEAVDAGTQFTNWSGRILPDKGSSLVVVVEVEHVTGGSMARTSYTLRKEDL